MVSEELYEFENLTYSFEDWLYGVYSILLPSGKIRVVTHIAKFDTKRAN